MAAEPPGAPSRPEVARAVSWVSLGHFASQALWLVSLLVLASILSPRDFGTLASAMVLVNLAGLLVDSGTRGSIIATPHLTRADVRGAIALNLAVGLAATVVIAGLAGPAVGALADGAHVGAVRVLAAGVLLYAAGITALALLQKNLRLKGFAAANIGAAVVSSVAAVVAGVLGAGVWALVLRQLLSMGLLSVFAWMAARHLVPAEAAGGAAGDRRPGLLGRLRVRQPGWTGFFLLAAADFVVLNVGFFVVGAITEAENLGVYSLAFTLAFAPLTQVSWVVGRVLFPAAAATRDLDAVGRRTLVSVRLMALLLLPLLAPAIALAPVLPELLGPEWGPIVTPFQILVLAGVGQALVGVIGESLSGTGNVGFRARVNLLWAVGMVGALIALVSADGLRGAALAHAALLIPFAAAYAVAGTRRIGTSAGRLGGALRGLAVPIAVQAGVTASAVAALRAAGASDAAAGAGGAAAGVAAVAVTLALAPSSPLREGRAVLAEALGRAPA